MQLASSGIPVSLPTPAVLEEDPTLQPAEIDKEEAAFVEVHLDGTVAYSCTHHALSVFLVLF